MKTMLARKGSAAFVLFVALLACGAERPLVESFDRGEWQPVPFQVTSMGGQYAAPRVEFVLRLEGPPGRRLTVEGTVEIDPRPTLVGGRWFEADGSTVRSGVLSSAAVDYFGGQGGRPSLRGQLVLSTGEAAIYRINLPRTTLTAER